MDKRGGGKAVKWIIGAAFIGWAGIVQLAYSMAEARMPWCYADGACLIRTQATCDYVRTVGLTVALVAAVIVALTYATELSQLNWRQGPKWRQKKQGHAQPIHLPDQRDV